jgi:hypothetical protein
MSRAQSLQFDLLIDGVAGELIDYDLESGFTPGAGAPAAIVAGVDRKGTLPDIDPAGFDLLLTTARAPSRCWIQLPAAAIDAELASLRAAANRFAQPAAVLTQVLRLSAGLSLPEALLIESFAYSTLLGGQSFRDWMRSRGVPRPAPQDHRPRVRCTRDGDVLSIHLADPARRNAFDARMRDELVEALACACDDPTLGALVLRGDGPDFSAGGDLREFGAATDLTQAHLIRTLRSPARLLGTLAARATAFLHGACVGAGIEIPAAAGRVVAAPDTRFWLPELPMGLIPGAGGTATIARRVGRHRLLYWALTARRLDAATALEWGLVDELRDVT